VTIVNPLGVPLADHVALTWSLDPETSCGG
jgi:hypothetical protein